MFLAQNKDEVLFALGAKRRPTEKKPKHQKQPKIKIAKQLKPEVDYPD